MKAARSAPAQTSTVAPIHAPSPSIERPSVTTSVTTSPTSAAISATPPIAEEFRLPQLVRQERQHQRVRDREDDDGNDEAARVELHSLEERCCHQQADGVGGQGNPCPDDEADHATILQRSLTGTTRVHGRWFPRVGWPHRRSCNHAKIG